MDQRQDSVRWKIEAVVRKYSQETLENVGLDADPSPWELENLCEPDEVLVLPGNVLTTAGATRFWNLITGAGSAGQFFDATHTRIGVGNTGAAAGSETASDTALGGASQYFKLVTGGPTVSGNQCSWQAQFGGSVANFSWNEWCIDNGTADGTTVTAPMINHKVVGMGTKVTGAVWTLTVTASLA